jgi:hypothetical protein
MFIRSVLSPALCSFPAAVVCPPPLAPCTSCITCFKGLNIDNHLSDSAEIEVMACVDCCVNRNGRAQGGCIVTRE